MPEALKKLIWPLLALGLLLAFNAVANRSFYSLEVNDGKLSGAIILVLQNAAPTMIVALGMTLVIATGGVDLSVGALMALAGAVTVVLLADAGAPLPVALLAALGACVLAGLWNGLLVAYVRVQPIVATLILMVAGRGIAQLLTGSHLVRVRNAGFQYIDGGAILGVPFSIWIAATMFVALAALVRLTAMGLFIEAVGNNETACRYAGLSVRPIRLAVYALSGLCACVAGLIVASDISASDAANAGHLMELDAILAVVIGGTSLAGGRFLLTGSILGAVIIQTLTTTILMTQLGGASIPAEYNQIVKGAVVLVVCLLQSPSFRSRMFGRKGGG
jgi:simple sugar transport system permease protein